MKEKSFFSRLFGGGAEAQRPRISSARREELAEELLPHLQKSDPVWDAIESWEESRGKGRIAECRGNESLPKAVELTFRCVSVKVLGLLNSYGIVVMDNQVVTDALWEAIKKLILDSENKMWLVRADKCDSSKLSEKERKLFATYFAEKGGAK